MKDITQSNANKACISTIVTEQFVDIKITGECFDADIARYIKHIGDLTFLPLGWVVDFTEALLSVDSATLEKLPPLIKLPISVVGTETQRLLFEPWMARAATRGYSRRFFSSREAALTWLATQKYLTKK